jgi:hypothetical protein
VNESRTDFENLYPNVAVLIGNGVECQVNAGGYDLQIAGLHDGSQTVCQFLSDGMSPDDIFAHLEALAIRYREEGIVTDEVNGTEYSIW